MKEILVPVDESLRTHPEGIHKIHWRTKVFLTSPSQASLITLDNPRFGKVEHMMVCKPDGTPLYDRYVVTQNPGVIIVPYDEQFRVGLMEQYRPGHETSFTSLPMGFAKLTEQDQREAAVRELRQEFGIEVDLDSLVDLGQNNLDPGSHQSFDTIYEVRCTIPQQEMDGHEGIVRVNPYGMQEIAELRRNGKLTDGLTNSALFMYATNHPEFFRT